MSVHKDITKHVNKINQRITEFLQLDQQRESLIAEAIELCEQGKDFSTDQINDVTNRINEIAKQGNVPARKNVTPAMVREYVEKLQA